jgi:hypothetical protein
MPDTEEEDAAEECMLCRPEVADRFFSRTRLWQNEHRRLSAVLQGPIPGFAHLETRRHRRRASMSRGRS